MTEVPDPRAPDLLGQAKRPVSALAGPYGHPFHPLLVTVPIGAWTASLVFDLASHVAAGPGFLAQGSLWLIVVGVIGALAAACAGFLDLFGIPAGTQAFRTALVHMTLNLVVVAGYAAGFAWRYGSYHHPGPVAAGAALPQLPPPGPGGGGPARAVRRVPGPARGVRVPRRQPRLPLRRPRRRRSH